MADHQIFGGIDVIRFDDCIDCRTVFHTDLPQRVTADDCMDNWLDNWRFWCGCRRWYDQALTDKQIFCRVQIIRLNDRINRSAEFLGDFPKSIPGLDFV